jgi:hypothetical protein
MLSVYGGIGVLLFNVGGGDSVEHGRETSEEWSRMLDINLAVRL